ncbi:hypothetical protein NUTIK01_32120 [Novosphingobium sp. IK01]|uniref:Uncharacterized protein n=1 Tax=Novosphingobium pituita TaxID=3056842 RepID=A0ABQ6PC06_9SPHN|nr:hypothetical protein NUTIK01_32120 [Novosphingobium sp. IK01]
MMRYQAQPIPPGERERKADSAKAFGLEQLAQPMVQLLLTTAYLVMEASGHRERLAYEAKLIGCHNIYFRRL